MLKKIMVATDGSQISMHAAEVAVNLAKISGASLTTLYVVDIHRLARLPGYTSLPGSNDQLMELMLREGNEANAKIAEMAQDAGIPCEKIIAKGNPGEEILRLSKEYGMDLLAIGSIGRSGLNKFLLGSVAEKVVRHSEVPIIVVPG